MKKILPTTEVEAFRLSPHAMALLLKGIKDHVEDPFHRPVVYQVAIGAQLFGRLMELLPKRHIDTFINQMLDMGMRGWREAVMQENFNNDEEIVDALVREACDKERDGARLH